MTHMEDEMEKMGPPAEEKQNEEAFQEEAAGDDDDAEEVIDGDDKGEDDAVDEEEQIDGGDEGEDDAVDEEEQIDGGDEGEDDAVDEEEQIDGDDKGEGDAVDEEEQIDGDEKEEVDGDHAGQEGSDDIEKKEEAIPLAAGEIEENMKLPVQPQEKKSSEGLNLNNEVVRMRKEVKRVRVLIIRKLTRHLGTLKKKKGKETEMERNQRRAARLLEEIHALTALSPDVVTKTALQKNLNFEEECKNPKATISDRAIARIATHPQFNKKIQDIKAAVKTFKEERMKGGAQPGKEKVQNKAGKVVPQPPDKKRGEKSEKVEDISMMKKKVMDKKRGDGIFKDTTDAKLTETGKETEKATNSADIVGERKEMPESKNVKPAICSKGKNIVQSKPQRSNFKSAAEELQKKKDVEDSDLESSDDEDKKKEYFDDSTEERFHKQSSQSEQSDDDFFIGKVSKFKKKKKQKSTEGEKSHDVKMDPTDNVQSKLDEPEARMKSKATSLQSVFCSLSASKPGSGRGRGGDGFRGRGKPRGGGSGPRGDFSKQSNFIKQGKGTETNSFSKFSKSDSKGFHSGGRGRGRGRGDAMRQNDRMGGGVFSHQATKQALHPSWEASKKRKEQQGKILAFQGKKIKFDDDD